MDRQQLVAQETEKPVYFPLSPKAGAWANPPLRNPRPSVKNEKCAGSTKPGRGNKGIRLLLKKRPAPANILKPAPPTNPLRGKKWTKKSTASQTNLSFYLKRDSWTALLGGSPTKPRTQKQKKAQQSLKKNERPSLKTGFSNYKPCQTPGERQNRFKKTT